MVYEMQRIGVTSGPVHGQESIENLYLFISLETQ